MLAFPLSPSAVKTYQQCPFKYEQMYVSHTIERSQSDAALRGDTLHKAMEASLKSGKFSWPEEKTLRAAASFFNVVQKLRDAGWTIFIEESICMSPDGKEVDWKTKPPLSIFKSRLDVYATHPSKDFIIVIDWKTGKKWEIDTVQLGINALCLQARTGKRRYKMCFAYLDSNEIAEHSCLLPEEPYSQYGTIRHKLPDMLANLYFTVQNIEASYNDNLWVAKKNKFCNWCKARCLLKQAGVRPGF